MKTTEGSGSLLYAIVAGLLRGALKWLILTSAFFITRNYLEHWRRD